MTTETEALRAQFEREIGEAEPFPVQRYGDSYAHRICAWAWEGYQAGHAAAKAETAETSLCHCATCLPIDQKMRMVVCGICGNKRCPHATNHIFACTGSNEPGQLGSSYGKPLYTADQLAAAVAAERERAATVVDEKIGSVCKANPGRGGRINSAVAFALGALRDCAAAIRAGAKEQSDA